MKPRRTINCNRVFRLEGGTEDNDLWTEHIEQDGQEMILSTWVPTDAERSAIAAGHNVELIVWGSGTPPVAMRTSDVPLGKPPRFEDGY